MSFPPSHRRIRTMSPLLSGVMLFIVCVPASARDWVFGTEAVVNVTVGSDIDPISASLPLALDQSKKLQKSHPKATQWIVNVDWPSARTGVQFILRGNSASFDGQTPNGWIGKFSFNGGSEKGVIEAGKWCQRGAARVYPAICQGVDRAVESRNVRHLIKN